MFFKINSWFYICINRKIIVVEVIVLRKYVFYSYFDFRFNVKIFKVGLVILKWVLRLNLN